MRARQTCNRVEQNDDVAFMLDEALRLFDDHVRDLHVTCRWFVKGRRNHLAIHRALHVSDFFRPLIDQQHDQRRFGMILCYGISDRLQQHRFTGTRRSDDQSTLSFAERRHQIDDAGGKIIRLGLHLQLLFGIEWRQVVEENFLSRLVGRFKVDGFDFDQGEITFAFLRWTNLTADRVAGAQVKLTNLRRRDIDVVRPRQIVVLRCAEKPEPVGQGLQHAFRKDETALFCLCGQYFEDELLLTHAGRAGYVHALGNLRELGDRHLLEISQIVKALVLAVAAVSGLSFGSFGSGYAGAAVVSVSVVIRARCA